LRHTFRLSSAIVFSFLITSAALAPHADAAPSLLDIVKAGELNPDVCQSNLAGADCAKLFSIIAHGQYQPVEPVFVSTSDRDTYAKLFP
jgi:hypothetical protein